MTTEQQPSATPGDPRITADALIDLRLNHPLAKKQRLLCPHDALFWTEAGRDLAAMAMAVDPLYAPVNIARYKWFTERLLRAADEVPQIIILGAGFDTRSMTLPQITARKLQVFEIDFPDKIAAKLDILARHQIQLPLGLNHIGADLGDALLRTRLATAGYRRDLPTVVLMEGVHFFLPEATAAAVMDPRMLALAPGSSLVFDLWTSPRQAAMNAKVEEKLGRRLFGHSPLGDSMTAVALEAQELDYGDIQVLSLERICAGYGIAAERDALPESWLILEAKVPVSR